MADAKSYMLPRNWSTEALHALDIDDDDHRTQTASKLFSAQGDIEVWPISQKDGK
jgi:hypothetical protein